MVVQVKEAREAAREAAALIQQLHRFVAEQGPDGDWLAWAHINLPYSGAHCTLFLWCMRASLHGRTPRQAFGSAAWCLWG